MGWIAPVMSIVGLGMQLSAAKDQKKATKAAEKREKVNQRIADIRSARERQKGIAAARVARAQQVAGAFGSGAQNSSALFGSLAGASADLASNIGFNSQIGGLSQQASIFNIAEANAKTSALTKQAYAGMASNIGSIFGGPTFG